MKKIKKYLALPIIFIHELSHVIFGLLCGFLFNFRESRIGYDGNGDIYVALRPKGKRRNLFQIWMVSLSPIWIMIVIFILGMTVWLPLLFIFVYMIFFIGYAIPSYVDIMYIQYAKVFIKYDTDSPILERFINIKKPGFLEDLCTLQCPEI